MLNHIFYYIITIYKKYAYREILISIVLSLYPIQ